MSKILEFLKSPFLRDYRTLFGLWMLLPVIMWIMKMTRANNYDIYRGSFWNAVRGWNLYLPNPEEYADLHHYGPVFSLLFALLILGFCPGLFAGVRFPVVLFVVVLCSIAVLLFLVRRVIRKIRER